MKSLFLSLALVAMPIASNASELTQATSIKLNSADGLTDLKNLKVKLSAYCTYKFGLIFPENKSCGDKTQVLSVDADGVVKIPAIEKFKGLHGKKTDNYKVDLSIYDGDEYLASLSAWGEKKVSNFKFDGKRLDIYRLNGGVINVALDGADFFGSPLSQVERASLGLSIDEVGADSRYENVLPLSSLEALMWSRENFASYEGKKLLKDTKEISVEKINFAKFNSTGKEEFRINVFYSNTVDYKAPRYAGSVTVSLGKDMIGNVGTVELKKSEK